MPSKKIKFFSNDTSLDILKPFPASRYIPDWYRTMQGVKGTIETVKKCIPVLDALTAGYIIPLPVDVTWEPNSKKFLSDAKFLVNSDHMIEQTDNIVISSEYDSQPHKWINNWFIKTPKGYSTLFIHPLNRDDLPFHSFSGIVDTDRHPLIINFPFVLRKDFTGTIPAGTPLIQAIPFKRDDWDSEVNDQGKSYEYSKEYEVFSPPFAWYKRNWWTRKLYR